MGVGLIAGVIDILPMIIQELDKRSTVSAYIHYFFVSIVILNINLPFLSWWLKGGFISLCLALPVILIVSGDESDRKAPLIMAAMSVILGTLISVAGHYLI